MKKDIKVRPICSEVALRLISPADRENIIRRMVGEALRTNLRRGQSLFQALTHQPPGGGTAVPIRVALDYRVDPLEIQGEKYEWVCIFDPDGAGVPFDTLLGGLPQDN
jgi:hypothetical protein